MDPVTSAALIGAGSQASSGLFGFIGQRRQNRHNLQLAKDARQHDVNMWNMQNQYNTPEMQMQRLKEAGLNPHLMYGQGNTGNAGTPQKAPVPEVGNELSSLSQMSLAPVLSMYQDWRVKDAQIENLQANAAATRENASLTALRQISQNFMNKKLGFEKPFWETDAKNRSYLLHDSVDLQRFKTRTAQQMFHQGLPGQLQQIILRNNLLEQQIRGQTISNDLNEKLKPYGATDRDSLIQRLLMMQLSPKPGKPNAWNMTPGEAFRYSFDNLKRKK